MTNFEPTPGGGPADRDAHHAPRLHGPAVMSLMCSVASGVSAAFCIGIMVGTDGADWRYVGLPAAGALALAAAAVLLGHSALSRIRRARGELVGTGRAATGLAVGYGSLAVSFIALQLMIVQGVQSRRLSGLGEGERALAENLSGQDAAEAYRASLRLLASGKQGETERLLDFLVKQHPSDQRLAFLKAACARSRFRVWHADRLLEQVAAMNADTVEGRCAALIVALDRGRKVQKHLDGLRQLLKEHPDDPVVLWLFAVQCRVFNCHQEGADAYVRLLKLMEPGPGPVLVHQTYANILSEGLGRHDEALEHRQLAVKLEPAGWSYQGLGNTLTSLRRYEEADAAFRKCTELSPDSGDYWRCWGRCLREWGRHEQAIEKYAKALECDDEDSEAMYGRACCLIALSRAAESLKDLREAADMGHEGAMLQLGRLYLAGHGVAKDEQEGFYWILKGAVEGDAASGAEVKASLDNPASREPLGQAARRLMRELEKGKPAQLDTLRKIVGQALEPSA